MGNMNDMEERGLVEELTQGRELANQLKNQINPLISKETCENLLQKILSTYDKALACVNLAELLQKDFSPIVGLVDSPESSDGISPKIGCAKDHSQKDFKKRRAIPRWSKQIKVPLGEGLERPLDDGHSWRKYGQKAIFGATHPRAYYRCTHKQTRGCMAKKQVQKTEKDPLIFEVTYRGKHTCMDVPSSPSLVVSLEENPEDIINNMRQQQQQPESKQEQKQNIPFMFREGLKVETGETNPKVMGRISSFSLPSNSFQAEKQNIWEQFEDDNILARLIAPATSESNYYSGSTCRLFPYSYGIGSDISDMISTPTSGMNILLDMDMDIPVEVNIEVIEPNFPFEVLDNFTTSE